KELKPQADSLLNSIKMKQINSKGGNLDSLDIEKEKEQLGSNNLKESFEHAIEGIVESIISERNLRIHFAIGLLVIAATFFLPVKREDTLWIIFAVFFVIWSELVNTIIEHLMNLYSKEYHPVIKIVKDVSAGVVLWATLIS
ncbi:MAG: diacylglycerol kinase family protein, partial [Fervidobacterium pennivorans]